jgi:hypothetical protein
MKKLEAALGYRPRAEVLAWAGTKEELANEWYVTFDLAVPAKSAKAASKLLVDHPLLVLAGLVPFARDPSGDQMFVSVRDACAPVLFDHETGELVKSTAKSVAAFVGKKTKATPAKPDKLLAPLALWPRVQWLLGLLRGEPAFEFAGVIVKAPPFAAWKKEKAVALLAPYWMLAHAFLGNADACREAALLAKKSKGWVISELAKTVLAYCDGKVKSPVEKLARVKFEAMRAVVDKNALPALFAKPPKASPLEDEVKVHDAALAALAKGDEDKQDLVKDYLRERTSEDYNHWPWKDTLPDWIIPAVAAAFRAGLTVDLGHPKAYAGVSRALAGRADHPDARRALIEAVRTLAPDDGRLGHAVGALATRDEPESQDAIREGAWRWLAVAQEIDKILAKRQKRFTLDDVFAKDDRLQPLVHAVLERCDDEAEKLALAISQAKLSFRVLKRTAGLVMRVYGKRGIVERYDRMDDFLALLDDEPGKPAEESLLLDQTACVAMAEASLAIARLDPARAKPKLDALFAGERRDDERRAGVVACVLPGVLHLDPAHAEALHWLERILGERGGVDWVYGALIAAREAKVARAVPWILPHAYDARINEIMEQFAFIEREARKTLAVLGESPPLFDEDGDQFASDVPEAKLGPALARRDRYSASHVLERMQAEESPAYVSHVTAYLEELVRFSRYEPVSHFITDELVKATQYLKTHAATAELARIRALPEIGVWALEMMDEA